MDDDIFDEEAPEIALVSKEWERVETSRFKDGFVAGSSQGQNVTLQDGFNRGYKHGVVSSFMIAKIRGVLGALLAYHSSYEGSPITDDVILEAQQILEDINNIEADSVADEILGMSVKECTNCSGCGNANMTDDMSQMNLNSMDVDNVNTRDRMSRNSSPECQCRSSKNDNIKNEALKSGNIKLNDANALIKQSPAIMDILMRSKHTLKKLKWTDEMIDSLL